MVLVVGQYVLDQHTEPTHMMPQGCGGLWGTCTVGQQCLHDLLDIWFHFLPHPPSPALAAPLVGVISHVQLPGWLAAVAFAVLAAC